MLYDREAEEILESFRLGNTCASSLFPYENTYYLYPINSFFFYIDENLPFEKFAEEMRLRKKVTKYMPIDKIKSIFKKIMQEQAFQDAGFSIDKNKIEDELKGLSFRTLPGTDYRESVRLNDPTGEANGVFTRDYYYYGSIFIENTKYLWFQIKTNLGRKKIESALNYLREMGLSGDRTVGSGEFDFKLSEETKGIGDNIKGGYYLLLSKYIPSKDDLNIIDIKKSSYRFEIFSGIYDYGKLGIYRYIQPGAILKLQEVNEVRNLKGSTIIGNQRMLSFVPLLELVYDEI